MTDTTMTRVQELEARVQELEAMLLEAFGLNDPFIGPELSGGPACVGCESDPCNGHRRDCTWVKARRLLGLPTE